MDIKEVLTLFRQFRDEHSDVLTITKHTISHDNDFKIYYLKVPKDCYLSKHDFYEYKTPYFIKLFSNSKRCFARTYKLTVCKSDSFDKYVCLPICINNTEITTMAELVQHLNILHNFIEEWKIKYREVQKKNIISKIEGI